MNLTTQPIALFWFRRDLRLHDNHALYQALNSGLAVLPIFIFDSDILKKLDNKADFRVSYIMSRIEAINKTLSSQNKSIYTLYGSPEVVIKQLITQYNIKAIYFNTDYEPYAAERDAAINQLMLQNGIEYYSFKDQVIFEKLEITKADKLPYTIFTPYKNRWKERLNQEGIPQYPSEKFIDKFYLDNTIQKLDYKDIGFTKSTHNSEPNLVDKAIINHYDTTRDIPSLNTTKLGIDIRFGTYSIRELVKIAFNSNETWLNELIWRDFFMMIMSNFPYSANNSFKKSYDNIEWSNNEEHFERWCSGKTGYPLVDAGMRELNATGFMHNRVRMITASFLCKNLFIDWRWGEAYFASKLNDYDLASNVGNWQWAAGCGCDAAPYFRVFNPAIQAQKYDKDFEYIKKWIPELNSFDYPQPIVDFKTSSKNAVEKYKRYLLR
jgi:deoxyribodipyrimidine photo-lyase